MKLVIIEKAFVKAENDSISETDVNNLLKCYLQKRRDKIIKQAMN